MWDIARLVMCCPSEIDRRDRVNDCKRQIEWRREIECRDPDSLTACKIHDSICFMISPCDSYKIPVESKSAPIRGDLLSSYNRRVVQSIVKINIVLDDIPMGACVSPIVSKWCKNHESDDRAWHEHGYKHA
jgi:hypothetical protein